ncbi:type II secretion system F family protein [Nocardioides jensenii]|uniref:type II secretion system F family protein n=1 Tax=Nocardioides jensenii TaxID=1843 RepID=UPI0008353748|nr:type II secretion system F family protein [Nocardioides jensenii]
MRTPLRRLAALGLAVAGSTALVLGPSPAAVAADDFTITHVQPAGGDIQVLLSVPEGAKVPLESLEVTIDGTSAPATAESAGESTEPIRRTTILAIDTSNSMAQRGRFDAAKAAAAAFLESAPDDVYVGVITFDADVETALAPTLDRASAADVVEGLELARDTRLNDAVIAAAELAGTEGQRNILVLSDGRDTSTTTEAAVTDAIGESGVAVDVVALDQSGPALAPLKKLADAGNGSVIEADAASLTAAFDDEAASLSRQVLLTAQIPEGVSATEGTVAVTSGELSATAHVVIRDASAPAPTLDGSSDDSGVSVSRSVMYAGVAAIGLGLLVLVGSLMWSAGSPKRQSTPAERIAAYTGDATASAAATRGGEPVLTLDNAKSAAASVLNRNQGLEARINQRLVAGGSSLKPAEWILIHGGIAIAAGLVGALLGKGDIIFILLFLALGALLPWLWLGRLRKKRINAFNSQLADTLTLVSGSLSAGMSLAQSLDTVVKEGREPVAGEFRQALVQSRLGYPLVDALDDIATRTESKDFGWTVMAIRIQRQVGGNLTELLQTVAATLRERDYLRRQVQTLSAEGRLSGWILGLLPVGMFFYMLLTRREYVSKLWTEPMGLLMLAGAVGLLSFGAFVIARLVKVEV